MNMKKQEGMIQSIITKPRGLQKDPGCLHFKLARRQHVCQINGIKAGEEYTDSSTQMRRIVSKESQYPGRKFMSSSQAIEKKRALWKKIKRESIVYNI